MKKKQFRKQLTQNTILYLSILSVSFFIITSFIYVNRMLIITAESNHNFLALMKTQTEHFLEHPIGEIKSLEEQFLGASTSEVEIQRDYHGYMLRIEYLDKQGVVTRTFPNNDMRMGMDMGNNPYLKRLTENTIIFSDTSIDHASGQVTMMAGKKTKEDTYLIGYMNLNKLGEAFSSFETHNNLFVIIDNKGNYILHPDAFSVESRDVDPNAGDIHDSMIESGDLVMLAGRTYMLEFVEIKDTGWHLLIYQDYTDILFPILLSIFLVVSSILIVFVLVIRSFNISFEGFDKGFNRLIQMTQKVAEGEYSAVLTDFEYEEFDRLSHNFITMISEIETREEEIQYSRDELRASNDELSATLQQLIAIDKEHRAQNEYLDHQNSRLANLIVGTHAGTWEWDIQKGDIIINERWADMLGYTLDDLSGFKINDFYGMICSEDLQSLKNVLDSAFEGQIPYYEVTFRMYHKAGHWVWIKSIGKIIHRDAQFNPLLMSGIHMDITESINTSEKIQERLKEVELIAEFTSRFLNNKSEQLLEILGELLNKVCEIKSLDHWSFIIFKKPDDFSILKEYTLYKPLFPSVPFQSMTLDYPFFYNLISESKKIHVLDIDDLPDGAHNEKEWLRSQNIISLTLTPIHDGQKTIGSFVFESKKLFKDIGQEEMNFFKILSNTISEAFKKDDYEKGLIESKELANAANIAKGQFLANMSHEIRTPLNGISGYLNLITLSNSQEDIKMYGEKALKVTSSMVRLIDDILDFSRIEAGKLKKMDEAVDVRAKIAEIIDSYHFEAQSKNVDLSYSIAEQVPRTIVSDATRLRQIISNLVSNAIKFSTNGKVLVKVDVEANNGAESHLLIEVIDTGIGIPENQLDAVFEPFNQGDNSSTRKYGGTGLGLSIVKQLVKLLSGSITVESTTDIGTRFTIKLPLIIPQLTSEATHFAPPVPKHNDVPARVLLVDDNEVNQLVVRKVLELKGFQCDVASNGLEAVEAIKHNHYDCVFMDIQMPIMDGYEATQMIRGLPDKSTVFIVAMTANAMSGDKEKCIEAGMDDYVSKPLDYDAMAEIILRQRNKLSSS